MNATATEDRRLRHLAWPGYVIAVIMFVMPVMDAVVVIETFSPTMYRWRFGVMGILSTNVVTPLVALLVALTIASLRQHLWVLRFLMVLTLAAAVLLAGMIIMFILDGLQMRSELGTNVQGNFVVVSGKALLAQMLALIGLGTIGWAARGAARDLSARSRGSRASAADLVVASPTPR